MSPPPEPVPGGAAGALGQEVVRLTRASHAMRHHLANRSGQHGVEWSTYVLLFHLVAAGPQRSGTLAESVHVDPSTVSRQVAQLVKLGLVERRPDPEDRRACLLAATDEGQAVYAAQRDRRDRAFALLVDGWSAVDVLRLAELLRRLNDGFDSRREEVFDVLIRDDEPALRPFPSVLETV